MPISTMSAQEYQSTIDRINQQNRTVEDRLADEERLKKELKRANRQQRKLNRKAAKSAATNAVRNTGWTGPVVVVLNEKGEKIGYCNRDSGQVYMKSTYGQPQARYPESRTLPAPVASQNVKRRWTLSDCVVEEVPIGGGLKGFDVSITKGGHTRTMRIYPLDRDNYEICRRAIENGNSPVANMWEDGRGNIVCWDNAKPVGSKPSGTKKGQKKSSKKSAPKAASANRKKGSKKKGSCNTKGVGSGRTSCSNGRCTATRNQPRSNQCIKRKGTDGKAKADKPKTQKPKSKTQGSQSRKGKR